MFDTVLDLSTFRTLDDLLESLYGIFKRDFIDTKTYLAGQIYINPLCQGKRNGKEEIFWHIVTRKNLRTKRRELDPERAKRIEWVKKAIENHNHCEIKSFYYYEDNKKIRFYIWIFRYDFLVILQKLGRSESYIVTSFYIDNNKKRSKLEKKYNDYVAKVDSRLIGCEWF